MPIQILPAILANQIAAGEVVERPASVIKELVENSLDAGATQIDVEIDRGGHKRILVRDNGKGIPRDELTLALSRHATSKIASLDDLESIISLGFRGEALASISSVARLTLTSRTAEQSEAWQAHAEGRDMDVNIIPAAHPQGTSVEVLDLFFNTPARRKFLRTEKTEFNHIEEVIKRIALSRFDVAFSLKHNGKLIKRYPRINSHQDKFRRVASVFGQSFEQVALQVNSQYMQLNLHGWLSAPGGERNLNDLQYVYVNGRMMRDKLINHAIRQAFEGLMAPEKHPAFCLYLEVPPDEVDVNVHPAKHEVRFHQGRLVHDFIFRALNDVLSQSVSASQPAEVSTDNNVTTLEDVAPSHDYIKPLQRTDNESEPSAPARTGSFTGESQSSQYGGSLSGGGRHHHQPRPHAQIDNAAAASYMQLAQASSDPELGKVVDDSKVFAINDDWLLLRHDEQVIAVSALAIRKHLLQQQFSGDIPVSQPLLMPVSIKSDAALLAKAQALYEPLLAFSIEIGWAANKILIRKVPAGYRHLPWTTMLPALLECQSDEHEQVKESVISVMAGHDPNTGGIAALLKSVSTENNGNIEALLVSVGRAVPINKWLDEFARG